MCTSGVMPTAPAAGARIEATVENKNRNIARDVIASVYDPCKRYRLCSIRLDITSAASPIGLLLALS